MQSLTAIDDVTLADLIPVIQESLFSQESAADELLDGENAKATTDLYRDASNRLTDFCAASPYRSAWACEPGCSACCFQPVPVTAVEALTIADYLQENMSPQRLHDVRVRLQQNTSRNSTHTSSAENDNPIRCAFLGEDRKCAVYPVRPLRCRGFHSLCAANCQAALQGDREASPCVDPQTHAVMRSIQSGLSGALRKQGRDGHYYRLDSAVLRALQTPDATRRWEKGENVFAACTRPIAIPDGLWIAPQDDGSIVELRRRENRRTGPEVGLIHIPPRPSQAICQTSYA